ncbi:MAG: hypothetical protein GX082_11750 [Clostridiaceae bacterium]|nr:hypothetical protein [Clostridiaceae bacterium]
MSVKAKAILCLFVFLISVVGCSREAEVSEKQTVPYSQSVTFKETEAKKETTTEKTEATSAPSDTVNPESVTEKSEPFVTEEEIDIMESETVKRLGIASNTSEARSGAIVKGRDGKFYAVLPSIGFLVCYDLETDSYTQHNFENNANGAPYKSFASQAGKFYTGAGVYFYEFDPVDKEFTKVINMREMGASEVGWGFCEDDNGIIYFSNYPKIHLYSYNPETGEVKNHGLLDETQQYCFTQGADSYGWVYNAIGTAEVNVIGFNVKTGEKKFMFPRIPGTGNAVVYKTKDGKVVANVTVTGKSSADGEHLGSWFVLENGEVKEKVTQIRHCYDTAYPWTLHIPYDDAPSIGGMDYPGKTFTYWDPKTKKIKKAVFDYKSAGANCSVLALGPNGIIYGTTSHPMNIFTVDPKTDTITDYGIKSIGSSVGNICCYASQEDILVGAAYAGGYIYRFDTKTEIINTYAGMNPRLEAKSDAIYRPRSALALSDGRTCHFSGYGGYGVVGAGMAIYDVKTGKTRVIENKDLLEYHGITAMTELPSGNVLCGTTVLAPGGGTPVYDTAALFEFNPQTYEVSNITYPLKGLPEIAHMVCVGDKVIGVTSCAILFVYDYKEQKVTYQYNLHTAGPAVRQGMVYKDGVIYLLMTQALLKINPEDYSITFLETFPKQVTSGIAVTEDAVYFCSGPVVYKALLKR